MPSGSGSQNNYYAAHHRKHSSQSLTNLPDQLSTNPSRGTSPNRSTTLLPSTTYHQPQIQHSGTSSFSNGLNLQTPVDPHDFYRHFQDSSQQPSPNYHQNALRKLDASTDVPLEQRRRESTASQRVNTASREQYQISHSLPSSAMPIRRDPHVEPDKNESDTDSRPSNTLRSRKPSIKDLVAKFDSTTDEVPPMPSLPLSRTVSASPNPSFTGDHSFAGSPATNHAPQLLPATTFGHVGKQTSSSNKPSGHTKMSQRNGTGASEKPDRRLTVSPTTESESTVQRRPLFGEVIAPASALRSPGYGIQPARRRRVSTGSPMHSPNPMFPRDSIVVNMSPSVDAAEEWYGSSSDHTSRIPHPSHTDDRPKHRRAQSDMQATSASFSGRSTSLQNNSSSHTRGGSGSRIPVSTKIHANGQDYTPVSPVSGLLLSSRCKEIAPLARSANNLQSPNQKSSSARRKGKSPANPGSHGKSTPPVRIVSSEKSPSLRANIIVPPPKISPPLRSSRPRQPVSAASTAASRAKMAEKFASLAKQHNDRRSQVPRSRPPELSDIDLKARRLRITQALSRSREGQDLRADRLTKLGRTDSRGSSATPSVSEADHSDKDSQPYVQIPTVYVNSAAASLAELVDRNSNRGRSDDEYDFDEQSGTSEAHFSDTVTATASPARENHRQPPRPPTLQTDLAPEQIEIDFGSISAITVETEATFIDDYEPQNEPPRPAMPGDSVLDQILRMRNQGNHSNQSTSPALDLLDRSDVESIQIMLRRTEYIDDDEAMRRGLEHLMPVPQLPYIPVSHNGEDGSWTSSIDNASEKNEEEEMLADEHEKPGSGTQTPTSNREHESEGESDDEHEDEEEWLKEITNTDAYTIVNILLQQRSPSGVVNQQLVDDIYQRVVLDSPELLEDRPVDPLHVRDLCLRELQEYEHVPLDEIDRQETLTSMKYGEEQPKSEGHRDAVEEIDHLAAMERELGLSTPPPIHEPYSKGHQQKPSLDSVEDWANTSPSIVDWMQYGMGAVLPSSKSLPSPESTLTGEGSPAQDETTTYAQGEERQLSTAAKSHQTSEAEMQPSGHIQESFPPPSHSPPPPPPISKMLSKDFEASREHSTGIATVHVPTRITSLTATSSSQAPLPPLPLEDSSMTDVASGTTASVEQRRLKQRRNVLKELVDTEYTYERDMRVLCDIYKVTATAALKSEDIKALFGNVDQVQAFARDFLTLLKQHVKPAYIMERSDRKKSTVFNEASMRPDQMNRISSTSSLQYAGLDDHEKDQMTRVGQAFEASLVEMEKVYTEYIRTRHAANKRLEAVQASPSVTEWLKECSDNSSDITNAWSLDALLVKPVQRITKYPLLLQQLSESTHEGHPDLPHIKSAIVLVTEINFRINEVKKHAELVDSALNRKRKDSDVRNGITKAFGRRAEKLKQHVGMSDLYEDGEYSRIRIDFDNNLFQLVLVTRDCHGYVEAMTEWVNRMISLASAAEGWVDVGHSHHAEAESKLRQFAMVVRGISTIALPDHIDSVQKRVIRPMQTAGAMLNRLKDDPKGLLVKRDKKLTDYSQIRSKKDKGEKVDRKTTERMEQWEALNSEAKERMKKLLQSTAVLVQACQVNLLKLHLSWLGLFQAKFSSALAIPLDKLSENEIIRDWKAEFECSQQTALCLSICNGSLLNEVANMASLHPPSSTLRGDESPGQSSWHSNNKRSISLHSEQSIPPAGVFSNRQSDQAPTGTPHIDFLGERSAPILVDGHNRAVSMASGRNRTLSIATGSNANIARPMTSPGRAEGVMTMPPRVSLDTPSPVFSAFLNESPSLRPPSTATFFSATAGPVNDLNPYRAVDSRGSIFSSAMPMAESPIVERGSPLLSNTLPATQEEGPTPLFAAASVYEFNIDRSRRQAGFPYLTYVQGEIFDIVGERGELWLARNQDDPQKQVGWIWSKHFAKLAG